jgi:hypothetical protein
VYPKYPAVSISKDDLRIKAAELTESEFLGNLEIYPHPGGDFLEAYRNADSWRNLPQHKLMEPRDGYVLHYESRPRSYPLVFLAFNGELVGVFESDNLTIDSSHQEKHLSRELILAGFAQAPWKSQQGRKVTEAGAAALRSAYRFARVVAFEQAYPNSLKYQPLRSEHWTAAEGEADYIARMVDGPLPNWPVEPLKEWLYRHASDMEDYAFLGFEGFEFELTTWDVGRLPGREAFRDERFCDSFQDVEDRAAANPHDWLAHYMLKAGTWNTPIILLDNRAQSGLLCQPELKTPYHLLEGHRRLSFVQGLKRLGRARAALKKWS